MARSLNPVNIRLTQKRRNQIATLEKRLLRAELKRRELSEQIDLWQLQISQLKRGVKNVAKQA